jgi:hypothetical protein
MEIKIKIGDIELTINDSDNRKKVKFIGKNMHIFQKWMYLFEKAEGIEENVLMETLMKDHYEEILDISMDYCDRFVVDSKYNKNVNKIIEDVGVMAFVNGVSGLVVASFSLLTSSSPESAKN